MRARSHLLLLISVLFLLITVTAQQRANASTAKFTAEEAAQSSTNSELAKQSREAAGEDDQEQFKHSGSVQFVSRITGLSLEHAYWLSVLLNFGIVNRRLSEIEARLSRLDVEIGQMAAAAEKEAAAEEERIKAAAEEDARKIVESADQEIAAAARAARRELTAYAADLAVSLAAKQIKVDTTTDQMLVRNFADELSATSNGSGPKSNDGG